MSDSVALPVNSDALHPLEAAAVGDTAPSVAEPVAPPSVLALAPKGQKAIRAFAHACLRQGLVREAAEDFERAGGIPHRAFERRGDEFAHKAHQYTRAVDAWQLAFLPHAPQRLIEKGVWLESQAVLEALHAAIQAYGAVRRVAPPAGLLDPSAEYAAHSSAINKLIGVGCMLVNRGGDDELRLARAAYLDAGAASKVQSVSLGDAFVRRRMYREAIDMYGHAGVYEKLVALSRKLRFKGITDLAYEALTAAGRPVPTDELCGLGAVLEEACAFDEAIIAYEAAGANGILHRLAATLERKGRYASAMTAARSAGDWTRIARIAETCRRKGRTRDAIEAYAILVSIRQKDATTALTALGRALLEQDKLNLSRDAFAAAGEKVPKSGLLKLLDRAIDRSDTATASSALDLLDTLYGVVPRTQLAAFICLCIAISNHSMAQDALSTLRDARMLRKVSTHALSSGWVDFARRAYLQAAFQESH